MPKRADALQQQADMLYRTAAECHRQHTRHSRLVERRAPDDEQRWALEMAYMCDDLLGTALEGYEKAKGHSDGHADDAWWHRANMLWHASREYVRRHASCDGMARKVGRQSPNRLAELTLNFDLEASALLAMRMAADAYRTARPEAE
ncbi:MAG TPA: hypothetical protein VM939_08095 [Gemmatimonadaceae bacterium]|nr:hypothetical protein [Gemmatimonadaceae bacterium]